MISLQVAEPTSPVILLEDPHEISQGSLDISSWGHLPLIHTAEKNRLVRTFCGGDEGDRTPYLLNAIQALSQVSYTPTGLPSRDCFAIIANPAGNVNPLFRENLKDFFAAYSALSLKALNAL